MGTSPSAPAQDRVGISGGTLENESDVRHADRAGDEPSQNVQVEPEKKKKRGFWAKVFGVGSDDDQQKKETDKKDKTDKSVKRKQRPGRRERALRKGR